MIIEVDILKYDGQWPRSICVLVILTILNRYLSLFTTTLRYLQETQLDSGMDELLHFLIVFLNFSFEKFGHSDKGSKEILFNKCIFTWWFCAKLNIQ